jgi:hypothetical protein
MVRERVTILMDSETIKELKMLAVKNGYKSLSAFFEHIVKYHRSCLKCYPPYVESEVIGKS